MRKFFPAAAVLGTVVLTLLLYGCSSPEEADLDTQTDDVEQVFTLEEIARYDGKDGQPAYIVVDGVVYDVTDVPEWHSGSHHGYEAGANVTRALEESAPHDASVLNEADIVGVIEDE